MGLALYARAALLLTARQESGEDPDPKTSSEAGQKEIYTSWALSIFIGLLVIAFFTSYVLQARKIQAVHETAMPIFAGIVIGLTLRLTAIESVLDVVTFDVDGEFKEILLVPLDVHASG